MSYTRPSKCSSSDVGRPVDQIEEAEERLGITLPTALRNFHRTFGRESDLLDAHNTLFTVDGLQVRDGRLIWCEENQGVMLWGQRVAPNDAAELEIANVLSSGALEWHTEECELATALRQLFYLQLAWGGLPHSKTVHRVASFSSPIAEVVNDTELMIGMCKHGLVSQLSGQDFALAAAVSEEELDKLLDYCG